MHLEGIIFKEDGKTPLSNVLIEAWQCDEHEHYDNVSDDYLFRGAVKTGRDGRYAFKTIVPVPYKDGDAWRPAHIHRVHFKLSLCVYLVLNGFYTLAHQSPATTHRTHPQVQHLLSTPNAPPLTGSLQTALHNRPVGRFYGPRTNQKTPFPVTFIVHPVSI